MDKYNLTNDIISQLVKKVNPGNSVHANKKIEHQNINLSSQHVLAIFTATDYKLNEALRELTKAKRYGFTFDVALSDNGVDVLGDKGIESIKSSLKPNRIYTEKDKLLFGDIIESVDGIIVPMTTQDTVAKLALGIQDNFISTLLWQSLWHGKTVLIDFENVITYRGTKSLAPMLQQIVDDYIVRIEKMGVTKFQRNDYIVQMLSAFKSNINIDKQAEDSNNLTNEENTYNKDVITEKDLLSLSTHRKELTVPMRTIITPLAYDTAKQLGIKIIKK